jgi:hypothetical protein
MDYSLVGDDEVVEMSFGPRDAMFQRLKDVENHLKPLFFKKMGKSDEKLIKTNMMTNNVGSGDPIGAKGVASMELTMGSKTLANVFFVIKVQGNYSVILGGIGFMPTIAYLLPCINS